MLVQDHPACLFEYVKGWSCSFSEESHKKWKKYTSTGWKNLSHSHISSGLLRQFQVFFAKDLWPPYFPNSNAMDIGIWSVLEQKSCTKFFLKCRGFKTKTGQILARDRHGNCACHL